jgi:translation initiation factor 6 (eIF-6)
MHVLMTDINGNPNIGLYGFCNDNFCLLGNEVPEKKFKEIEDVLKVKCHRISIAGTSLIGVFVAGNNGLYAYLYDSGGASADVAVTQTLPIQGCTANVRISSVT